MGRSSSQTVSKPEGFPEKFCADPGEYLGDPGHSRQAKKSLYRSWSVGVMK
jgi:hypothetical protein